MKWKRIGVILMAITMSMSLNGCYSSRRIAAEKIEEELEEKYGEEFQVINIGGRNGGNMDVITAHCCPVANEDIVFQARLDSNGNLVSDGYIKEYVVNEVEEYVKGIFEKYGLEAQINMSTVGAEGGELYNLDITNDNLLETAMEYDVAWAGTIAVRDIGNLENMAEKLHDVMEEIWEQYPQIRTGANIFVVSSEDYDACVGEMREYKVAHTSIFRDYEILGVVNITINAYVDDTILEGISKTEEEILQSLEEEFDEYYR